VHASCGIYKFATSSKGKRDSRSTTGTQPSTLKLGVSRSGITTLKNVSAQVGPVGCLSAYVSQLLLEFKIIIQQYWNGRLVGKFTLYF
jgi:hypothetical protein